MEFNCRLNLKTGGWPSIILGVNFTFRIFITGNDVCKAKSTAWPSEARVRLFG